MSEAITRRPYKHDGYKHWIQAGHHGRPECLVRCGIWCQGIASYPNERDRCKQCPTRKWCP